ncbi:MAG TPA: LacI family DNA-binding transcriptional regulator [Chloroflexota bacterium]|nr:LacI family DNA-binding transcriptional regulator [Chloroflexota bacterium]
MVTRRTAREVAQEAGVSLATVSNVLNGKAGVSEETRERVLAIAERLGYQPRTQRSVIGLLIERLPVPAYNDPAVGLMIQGVENEASRRGYHMLLASLDPGFAQLPAMVTGRQVSGLIVLGGGDISDAFIRMLVATKVPVVLADNFVDGLAVPCVLADNETGAYLATCHLIELGHRRIAMLEGPRKYKTLTERLEGYLRAHDLAQITPDPTLMIRPLHGNPRKGYRETQALLELPRLHWPTAIFAVSDKTALGALEALKDAGVRVPDDMALVGFDDIAESAHTVPPLTTVRLPMQGIGQVAVQRLIDQIEGRNTLPSKTVLYTELVVRQSSGARPVAATA